MIKDRGIGIPKIALDKIFDKFFRAENALKAYPDGAGIGLPLARKIIKAHGGSILIDSIENEGTTVTIFLPIK